jgi:hypothetical protein
MGIFWGASNEAGAANEQHCSELGANCVCSEPLNTSTYNTLTAFWLDPADTTGSDKQCTRPGPSFPGAFIEDNSGMRYVSMSSGEMITALPAGHLPGLRVLRTKTAAEGNSAGGGQFLGTKYPAGAGTARRAFRAYMYYSPSWEMTNGACLNSGKIFQFGNEPNVSTVLSGNGSYLLYGWTGWNVNAGCCYGGPGNDYGGYDNANVRGKWFRYELVITNTTTNGQTSTIKVYMKNVTDNLPERTIIDTTIPSAQPVDEDWTLSKATTLKPAAADIVDLWIDIFRNGSCAGYVGLSHILAAAWTTDAGQRIGAAVEIEGGGGGGDIVPPLPPINLRISKMMMEEGQ